MGIFALYINFKIAGLLYIYCKLILQCGKVTCNFTAPEYEKQFLNFNNHNLYCYPIYFINYILQ